MNHTLAVTACDALQGECSIADGSPSVVEYLIPLGAIVFLCFDEV